MQISDDCESSSRSVCCRLVRWNLRWVIAVLIHPWVLFPQISCPALNSYRKYLLYEWVCCQKYKVVTITMLEAAATMITDIGNRHFIPEASPSSITTTGPPCQSLTLVKWSLENNRVAENQQRSMTVFCKNPLFVYFQHKFNADQFVGAEVSSLLSKFGSSICFQPLYSLIPLRQLVPLGRKG